MLMDEFLDYLYYHHGHKLDRRVVGIDSEANIHPFLYLSIVWISSYTDEDDLVLEYLAKEPNDNDYMPIVCLSFSAQYMKNSYLYTVSELLEELKENYHNYDRIAIMNDEDLESYILFDEDFSLDNRRLNNQLAVLI